MSQEEGDAAYALFLFVGLRVDLFGDRCCSFDHDRVKVGEATHV